MFPTYSDDERRAVADLLGHGRDLEREARELLITQVRALEPIEPADYPEYGDLCALAAAQLPAKRITVTITRTVKPQATNQKGNR